MLTILTIHEAVPGHYLQGVYSSRVPSIIRAVFRDGVYAEGWAVYVTQVMMDAGFAETDPALMLCHWKYYLRSATNALIDVGIHTAGMTEAEAIDLMVDGAFQEMAAARAKYDRARLSSTQLSTYFVGCMAFWELEREVRRRAAVAAGAGAGRGAGAAGRRRVRGDARLRPASASRALRDPRRAADAAPAPARPRLGEDPARRASSAIPGVTSPT